jgi:hypothetical protein
MEKKCPMCKKILNIDKFYRDRSRKTGYKSCCKTCDDGFKRNLGKDFLNARMRKRLALNRLEMNDSYWMRISRRHNLSKDLLKSIYMNQTEKCFYCKIHIDGTNLQVDHYYPQENTKIVISCADCNRLKWQKNGDEFILFLKTYILRFN